MWVSATSLICWRSRGLLVGRVMELQAKASPSQWPRRNTRTSLKPVKKSRSPVQKLPSKSRVRRAKRDGILTWTSLILSSGSNLSSRKRTTKITSLSYSAFSRIGTTFASIYRRDGVSQWGFHSTPCLIRSNVLLHMSYSAHRTFIPTSANLPFVHPGDYHDGTMSLAAVSLVTNTAFELLERSEKDLYAHLPSHSGISK